MNGQRERAKELLLDALSLTVYTYDMNERYIQTRIYKELLQAFLDVGIVDLNDILDVEEIFERMRNE